MNRYMLIGLIVCFISACAGEPAKSPAATGAAAPPATASAPAAAPSALPATPNASNSFAPGPAGTATVVFYRPSHFVGGAIGFIVRENTTELGKLRSGKYFTLHVSPGKHTYVVHSEATDQLTIDADAGETYYIEGEIGMGVVVGHPHLKPSDKAGFDAAQAKLTEVPPLSG